MNSTVLFSLRLTFQVAATATFFVFIVGLFFAYILARKQFKGKALVDVLFTITLVLPPTVTGYYLIFLFGRNGLIGGLIYKLTGLAIMFTWYAAALASFVVSLPLMIKVAGAAIESVDEGLIYASYTLGHSELSTARRIIFPLAKNGIIAGTMLSFARATGEFGATLMIAGNIPGKTDTMPLAIYTLASSGEWGKAHAMVILLTVLSGLCLVIARRYTQRII